MRSTPARALLALALLTGALIPAAQAQEMTPVEETQRSPEEIYADLNFFGEVFDRIRTSYVDVPDERELVRAAVNGMLTSLDPHSAYLTPEDMNSITQSLAGEFTGLGIEIVMEEGVVKVIAPYDGTPAARAGIMPNDYIVRIGDEEVLGMTQEEAVSKMRGPAGTEVTIAIVREGVPDEIEVTVTRDIIALRVVRWSMEGDVAFIRISNFNEQTYPGLEKAIRDIYAERDGVEPQGIILDLRTNPGGSVDQSVFVVDAFLPQGTVVMTRGRSNADSTRYDAVPDEIDALVADVPLIVLINGGTASASEIVAGALQDHKRATLVGTRSYGKGSVQSIIRLGNNGGIKMTTARYYTPANRSIQAAGIAPDIEIFQDVPEEYRPYDEAIGRGEAQLPGHIDGGDEEERTAISSNFVPADQSKDNQLNYALALIRGEETNPAFPPSADD